MESDGDPCPAGPPCGLDLGAKISTVTAPPIPINKEATNAGEIFSSDPTTVMEVRVLMTGANPKTKGITKIGLPP